MRSWTARRSSPPEGRRGVRMTHVHSARRARAPTPTAHRAGHGAWDKSVRSPSRTRGIRARLRASSHDRAGAGCPARAPAAPSRVSRRGGGRLRAIGTQQHERGDDAAHWEDPVSEGGALWFQCVPQRRRHRLSCLFGVAAWTRPAAQHAQLPRSHAARTAGRGTADLGVDLAITIKIPCGDRGDCQCTRAVMT